MSEEKEKEKQRNIRARVFHIVQQEKHEETGEVLLTRDRIIQAIGHKTISNWAFILHNKDADENGNLKNSHFHIVVECRNTAPLEKISEWFGVPRNFIDLPKGRGAFGDCVAYLTHEEVKESGKYVYERSEVFANFDIDKFFEKRIEEKKKYGASLSEEERMMLDVLLNGKTLLECERENALIYAKNIDKLRKLRSEHLSKKEPPELRINIYVTGKGGMGKDLMSRAIARALFPQYERDEEIFFNVGARGSAFEGYDGQPVIIWSDRRAIDLLMELNGRGNVFEVFDSHPRKTRQNIKYSSIALTNCVNIINAVEPYKTFLNGLAGEYIDKQGEKREGEDKTQSYRRIPIILELSVGAYDMLVNKGWLDDDKSFLQYITFGRFRQNLKEVAEKCKDGSEVKRQIENNTVRPIKEVKEKIEKKHEKIIEDSELLEMFKDSGKKIEKQEEFIVVGEQEKLPFDE